MGCRASLCIIRKYLLQPNGQARCCCRWCTGPCRCSSNGRGRGRGNKSQPGQPGFLGLVMMKCSRLHMHITAQDGVYSPSECCSQQGCGHLISSHLISSHLISSHRVPPPLPPQGSFRSPRLTEPSTASGRDGLFAGGSNTLQLRRLAYAAPLGVKGHLNW